VFATVHQASDTQRINISPATRSRFTTITLTPYTQDAIQALLQQQLTAQLCRPGGGGLERGASPREAAGLLELLLTLAEVAHQELRAAPNVRQLLRCVQYVAAAEAEPSLEMRVLVGFRWLVLDSLQPDPVLQQQLAARVLEQYSSNSSSSGRDILLKLQQLLDTAFQTPDDPSLQNPGALLRALPTGHVQLAFTGVAALAAPSAEANAVAAQPQLLTDRLRLSPTPSLVSNMARILAASTVQGPLLLEGPPGIGKTAVVHQVAALLGFSCERINFSANTTLEQLLGSFIPKVVGGQRLFAWQDGVLVRAVRQGKWLLLDEINLAPPEVLAAVAPLFDR
jgi:MoxR-like ATPase